MSHLQYFSYEGVGKRNLEQYRYNQAVRIGDRIEIAGQGGWDPSSGAIDSDIRKQIFQAFANVDLCLKDAGGKGWQEVFRMNTYHCPLNPEVLGIMKEALEKYAPDHCPIWTCVGVTRLADEEMKVEIEVVAHIGPK